MDCLFYFQGSNITTTCSGHGHLVICDDNGLVHLITRTFLITTFRAYQLSVLLSTQLQNNNLLITIGVRKLITLPCCVPWIIKFIIMICYLLSQEDELDSHALLKVWDLERRDRQNNPTCVRTSKLPKLEKATTLCVTDNRLLMAVGFVDGSIALYKGDLSRDRNSKPKMLKELGQEITGMAFKHVVNDQWYLFVSTASSVQQFNLTSKDLYPMVINYTFG